MTKINLLLVRGAKKKETIKQQIFILAAILILSVVIMAAFYTYIAVKVNAAKNEIARSENEIQQLKAKIGEIENLKKLQDDVKKKLDVLSQLRNGKTGPVKRLSALSDAVPEKLWLTKYSESGNDVVIGGVAFTEELIAGFMRSLEASGEFFQVELQVSEQIDLGGVKAKRFDLACKLQPPKKEEPKAPQQPKK